MSDHSIWVGKPDATDYEKRQAALASLHPGQSAVRITGIDIPFGQLVGFLIKLGFAAIPAAFILGLTGIVLWAFWLNVSRGGR